MQDEPTPTELITAVADFLRTEITPVIKGHNAFKLRVGINALDLVTRQLALAGDSDAAEAARLKPEISPFTRTRSNRPSKVRLIAWESSETVSSPALWPGCGGLIGRESKSVMTRHSMVSQALL